jgi:hypothetical protein
MRNETPNNALQAIVTSELRPTILAAERERWVDA